LSMTANSSRGSHRNRAKTSRLDLLRRAGIVVDGDVQLAVGVQSINSWSVAM
jgi:hypothetical protein